MLSIIRKCLTLIFFFLISSNLHGKHHLLLPVKTPVSTSSVRQPMNFPPRFYPYAMKSVHYSIFNWTMLTCELMFLWCWLSFHFSASRQRRSAVWKMRHRVKGISFNCLIRRLLERGYTCYKYGNLKIRGRGQLQWRDLT